MAASVLHQTIVEALRATPALVLSVLRTARADVPDDVVATEISASFSPIIDDLHVDDAVALRDTSGALERVVLVDVQISRVDDKLFTLPVYQALARRRHRAPCEVVVLALSERVARRLRAPIALGGGSVFRATVVGKAELAALDPQTTAMPAEMTLLRTLVVNRDRPQEILDALTAFDDMPEQIGMLYSDLTVRALSHAVRRAVERLMQQQGYQPKSRLLRNILERGREEGREQGREEGREEGREQGLAVVRATIRTVLGGRGVALGADHEARLSACRDPDVLVKWATRAATAADPADVFEGD